MDTKALQVRLPNDVAIKVQKLADESRIGFSTIVRMLVCEHLTEKKFARLNNQEAK